MRPQNPRHAKRYRNLYELQQKIQAERVAGFKAFVADVRDGSFPGAEHVVKAPDGLMDSFRDALDK